MKAILIDPYNESVSYVNVDGVDSIRKAARIDGGLDYGNLGGSLTIWVYEFGLVRYVPGMRYFALHDRQLRAGRAVITAYDGWGETIDVPDTLPPGHWLGVRYLGDREAAILAVESGEVDRPQVKVNGVVVWSWPDITVP